jgi:aminopeptidase YwaD
MSEGRSRQRFPSEIRRSSWPQLRRTIQQSSDKQNAWFGAQLDRISRAGLQSSVAEITGFGPRSEQCPSALERMVEFLVGRFTPLAETRVDSFGSAAGDRNVVVSFVGATRPQEVLELAAHFDTVDGSPGADDNASALAALLELATVFSTLRLERTVRLVCFGREETGMLGSRAHVARIRSAREQLAGAIVLEMIGYTSNEPDSQRTPVRIPVLCWPPRQGNFIACVSNFASRFMSDGLLEAGSRVVPELETFALRGLGGLIADASRSDHLAYWRADYRAIMLTDTANFRNPNYHRPTDTAETLDYVFLQRVARCVGAAALHWASVGDPSAKAG